MGSVQDDVLIKAILSDLFIRFICASLFSALLLFDDLSKYTIFTGL
jgi:hypothetical protein